MAGFYFDQSDVPVQAVDINTIKAARTAVLGACAARMSLGYRSYPE